VTGSFRLEFVKNENGRFFADLDFDAPVLRGDGFFAQFWPDRMIYRVRADYEKTLAGGLFGAWYAPLRRRHAGRQGRRVPGQPQHGGRAPQRARFERLEKAIRFEVWGGVDFKYDYDFGLKLGINTANERRGGQRRGRGPLAGQQHAPGGRVQDLRRFRTQRLRAAVRGDQEDRLRGGRDAGPGPIRGPDHGRDRVLHVVLSAKRRYVNAVS